MPYPKKGEKQSVFVSRAIQDFRHEGYGQKESVGRAYGFYRSRKSSKNKKRHVFK